MDPVSAVKQTLDTIKTTGVSFRELGIAITRTNPTDFLHETAAAVNQVDRAKGLANDLLKTLSSKGRSSPRAMLKEVIDNKEVFENHNPTKETILLALGIIAQELANDVVNIPSGLVNKPFKASAKAKVTHNITGKESTVAISIHNLGSSNMEFAFSVRGASNVINRLDSHGLPDTDKKFVSDLAGLYGLLRTIGLPRVNEFNETFVAENSLISPNKTVISPTVQKAIFDFIKSGCRFSVEIEKPKKTIPEHIATFMHPENEPIIKRVFIKPTINDVDDITARKNAFAINAIAWLLKQYHDK